MTEIKCGNCHEWQPVSEYQPDPTKKRGYKGICRTCKPWPEPKPPKKPKFSARVAYQMCGKKVGFKKRETALAVALKDAKRVAFMRVYQCPICKRWHVTHRAERTTA